MWGRASFLVAVLVVLLILVIAYFPPAKRVGAAIIAVVGVAVTGAVVALAGKPGGVWGGGGTRIPEEAAPLLEELDRRLEDGDDATALLTGKYASGESTLADLLRERYESRGVKTAAVSLDNVVEEALVGALGVSREEAFEIYNGIGGPERVEAFVAAVKGRIAARRSEGARLVIVDGALRDAGAASEIFGEESLLVVVCLQPSDFESHKARIVSRIRRDVTEDLFTLPGFWEKGGLLDREAVRAAIERGDDLGVAFAETIDPEVEVSISKAKERCDTIAHTFANGPNWQVFTVQT